MRAYLIDAAMRRIIEFDFTASMARQTKSSAVMGVEASPSARDRWPRHGTGTATAPASRTTTSRTIFWPTIATSAKPTRRSPNPHQA